MKKKLFTFILVITTIAATIVGTQVYFLKRPYLSVIGFVKMADGLGRQSVELMDALYDDVSIGFVPTRKSDFTDVPQRIVHVVDKPNRKLGSVIIYESSLPSPDKKADANIRKYLKGTKRDDQIRIAYSMLESSRIPPKWAEILNTYFDAVAVPDPFLVEVYEESGVEIPIFVLPLGLELSPFLEQPYKCVKNTPFRFINISSMVPRKNHEGLILAFHKAFGNNPEVELHMNYRYSASSENLVRIKNLIRSLEATNIFLTSQKLDNQEYLDFFMQGDAFVSLSKGEGFSIQPREAMALGLPVIISDNTAHKTILESGLAYAVPCPFAEIAYNSALECECGEEYAADVDAAAKVMRHVYKNYNKCLKTSFLSKEWAAQYQYKNLKPLYVNLIKPAKILLGDRNEITEEYLMTSSPELYRKYTEILPGFPCVTETDTVTDTEPSTELTEFSRTSVR